MSSTTTLPTFSFNTTAEEVANVFADEIRGKTVLITGTSLKGIGFETARVIAKYAKLLIIAGYNEERLKLSEDAIKKETPSANIYRLTVDLSSLASVRKAAAEVNALPDPLHVLINNAAATRTGFALQLTSDNIELQYATNHVGPWLFTNLLVPKLLASSSSTEGFTPRVIFLSSDTHYFGTTRGSMRWLGSYELVSYSRRRLRPVAHIKPTGRPHGVPMSFPAKKAGTLQSCGVEHV
ncbi:hypothetical protein R3P38DRAFT_3505215 [Favolaschia claudopus]|uniref:NAD(P)-binding protein n=1 Tax=Favolaschia claudopus TaxID=2862362 RepID=A0AAV9Z279_9AGAR